MDILIGTLQERNRRLRASLERIDFGAVQLNEAARHATVRTREVWSYEHVDAARHISLGSVKRVEYDLLYTLERQGNRWLVAALALKEERAEK